MYEVFDPFLTIETWHTTHALDVHRFNKALGEVVRKKAFNPDSMAEYFIGKLELQEGTPLIDAARRYASDAWAVRTFLEAHHEIEN
ncbi:MAG: hypothetical protein APF80_02290 [Alphaproteobacteria bacterium BRH_c36]|nr:MAG: hypothetical protein APF80_02290 [Alphaproteobacteria bacterium BRH_c36]